MNIATLTIEMAANVARLRQDMESAASVVQGATAKMQKAAELAGKALGLIGVGLSLTAFTGFIRNAIDAADALDEMSGRVGVSAKELSGLQLAYKQAGMGNDAMASSLAKLSREMSEGNAGLRALGVNTRNADGSLRGTTAVLLDVADKFTRLEDGAAKTALAVEIFGKSGTEMVPLLNSGSEGIAQMTAMAEKLGLVIEDSAAAQAGQFNDTLELLGLGVQGVGSRIAAQLLPTLNNLTGSFLESMTSGDRLKGVADFLAASLKILYTVGVGIVEVFSTVGKTLGAAMGQVMAILKGDFAQASAIGKEWQQDVTTGWATTSAAVQAAWSSESNAAVVSAATTMKVNKDLLAGEKAREEAAKKTKASADKAAQEAIKKAADGAKLVAGLLAQDKGYSSDYDEKLSKMAAAFADDAISAGDLVKAQELLLAQQPLMKKAFDEAVKASQAAADARRKESDGIEAFMRAQEEAAASALKSVKDRITSLQDEEQAAEIARALNIGLAEAVERVALARLQEKQARFVDGSEGYERIRIEIEERQKLLAMIAKKDVREREERGWVDMWSSVDRTAHDVFTNVFEGGSDVFKRLGKTLQASVLDVLYQMTVRKWMISIGTSVFGEGFAAAAKAATGGGAGGGILDLFSNGQSLYSGYTGLTSGQGMLGSVGKFFGLGPSMNAAYGAQAVGSYAAPTGAAMVNVPGAAGAGGMSGMAAGGVFAAVAALVLNAVGAFKSERKNGGGLMGTLGGGPLNAWEEWREGGTLFSGPSFNTFNPTAELDAARDKLAKAREAGDLRNVALQEMLVLNLEEQYSGLAEATAAQSKIIQTAYDAMRTSAGDMADVLGMSSDKVREFTTLFGGDKGLSLDGLKPEEQQAKIAEALAGANNELAQQLIGTWETTSKQVHKTITTAFGSGEEAGIAAAWETVTETITGTRYVASEYAKEGEKAIDTLTRLASSLATVKDLWADMRLDYEATGLAGANAASKIADAFGGLEPMVAQMSAYIGTYFTETEKRENLARRASAALQGVGLAVNAQDILGASLPVVRGFVEAVMAEFGPDSKQYVMAVTTANTIGGLYEAVGAAADDAKAAAEAAKAVLAERYGLETRLLQLQGNTAALRSRELAQLDESNRSLQEYIWALEDAAVAAQMAVETERNLIAARAQAAQDAYSKAQANTTAAMASLDRAVGAQRAVYESARATAESAASEFQKLINTLGGGIKDLYGEVDSTRRMSAAAGMDFVANALKNARLTGYLPDAADLGEALAAARRGMGAEVYTTQFDADRERLVLAGQLSELSDLAQPQLTAAERAVKKAEEQLKALDDILRNAREQVDALRGIDTSVRTIPQALAALQVALVTESRTQTQAFLSGIVASLSSGQLKPQDAIKRYEGKDGEVIPREQWVDLAGTNAWISTGGATALGGNASSVMDAVIHGKGGAQFTVRTAVDYVQEAMRTGNLHAIYSAAVQHGISSVALDSMMGWPSGTALGWAKANGMPAFADGGMHAGGLRMVGERGWEIEATGPARIWNQQQLGQALQGGNNSGEVVAELRLLRRQVGRLETELGEIKTSNGQMAGQQDEVTDGGNATRVEIMNVAALAKEIAKEMA